MVTDAPANYRTVVQMQTSPDKDWPAFLYPTVRLLCRTWTGEDARPDEPSTSRVVETDHEWQTDTLGEGNHLTCREVVGNHFLRWIVVVALVPTVEPPRAVWGCG